MRVMTDDTHIYWVNPIYPTTPASYLTIRQGHKLAVGDLTGLSPSTGYRSYYSWYNSILNYHSMPSLASVNSSSVMAFVKPANQDLVHGVNSGSDVNRLLDVDDCYTVAAQKTGFDRKYIWRNVDAGASDQPDLANGVPYFKVGEVAVATDYLTEANVDGTLIFSEQINCGAMPPPLCKYITSGHNRIYGVKMDTYNLIYKMRIHSDEGGYANTDMFYPTTSLPDGFTPWTPNLKLKILEGTLAGNVYDVTISSETVAIGGVNHLRFSVYPDYTCATAENALAILYDKYAGSFFYTQVNEPFYWGDTISSLLNTEPYALFAGDDVMGIKTIGQCVLVLGKTSTSVSVNRGTDDIPRWVTGCIAGGVLSHWSTIAAGNTLFALSPEGPVYFKPPTSQDVDAGYFGEWVALDMMQDSLHRKCRDLFTSVIDTNRPEYTSAVYESYDNWIEWSMTALADSFDGGLQLRYQITTGEFFVIDGRFKNCYGHWKDSNGYPRIIHGDKNGIVHMDYTSTYEGKSSVTDIGTKAMTAPTVTADVTTPTTKILSDRYVITGGTHTFVFPELVGTKAYAMTYSSKDSAWIANPNDWRLIVDIAVSTDDYIYFDARRDWLGSTYTSSTGTTRTTYPYAILLGGIYCYLDTPALTIGTDSIKVEDAKVRIIPMTGASGSLQFAAYEHGNTSNLVTTTKVGQIPFPTIATNTDAEIFKTDFGKSGATINGRLFTLEAGAQGCVRDMTIRASGLRGQK